MILLGLVFCLILSFLLSGLEAAIFSVSIVRVRHRSKEAGEAGKEKRLERVLTHRRRLLTAVLLTNNGLSLAAFAFAAKLLVEQFGDRGYWITFLISIPVYILWFELVPKTMFRRFPYRALRSFVIVLEIINATIGQILRLVAFVKPVFQEDAEREQDEVEDQVRVRSEFRDLAGIISREGSMAASERELIESVMDFRRILVSDLMIPIASVKSIPLEMPAEEIVKLAKETGIDEFPARSKNGDLVGVVSAFEILRGGERAGTAVNYLRRLMRTSADDHASVLIPRLRKSGLRLAAVLSTESPHAAIGIISLSDILQQMLKRGLSRESLDQEAV